MITLIKIKIITSVIFKNCRNCLKLNFLKNFVNKVRPIVVKFVEYFARVTQLMWNKRIPV